MLFLLPLPNNYGTKSRSVDQDSRLSRVLSLKQDKTKTRPRQDRYTQDQDQDQDKIGLKNSRNLVKTQDF